MSRSERGSWPVPTVQLTSALRRFLRVPETEVCGGTVGEALAALFAEHPTLRGYLLDDQGGLRRHVNIYINGALIRDRGRLSDAVGPADAIFVVQALTGG
jgi:sulfur-carrier protein